MSSFVVILPLFCLIDDVTYLHVERPVLRLQNAAGGSLWQHRGQEATAVRIHFYVNAAQQENLQQVAGPKMI